MTEITLDVVKDFSDAIDVRIEMIKKGPTGLMAFLMASAKPWQAETFKENDDYEIEQLRQFKVILNESQEDISALKKINNQMYGYAIKAMDTLIDGVDKELENLELEEGDPLANVFQEEKQMLIDSKDVLSELYQNK